MKSYIVVLSHTSRIIKHVKSFEYSIFSFEQLNPPSTMSRALFTPSLVGRGQLKSTAKFRGHYACPVKHGMHISPISQYSLAPSLLHRPFSTRGKLHKSGTQTLRKITPQHYLIFISTLYAKRIVLLFPHCTLNHSSKRYTAIRYTARYMPHYTSLHSTVLQNTIVQECLHKPSPA